MNIPIVMVIQAAIRVIRATKPQPLAIVMVLHAKTARRFATGRYISNAECGMRNAELSVTKPNLKS